MTAAYVAQIPTSAHRETAWARNLRDGLNRHGPTPTFDEVVAALGLPVLLTTRADEGVRG